MSDEHGHHIKAVLKSGYLGYFLVNYLENEKYSECYLN